MPDLIEAPPPLKQRRYNITAENARALALLSHAPNSARHCKPPEPAPIANDLQPATLQHDFVFRKLARVREQIERVEGLLDEATEPQAVDRLANALTRLYELERVLAGRPLPGSRRPGPERGARPTAGYLGEPLDVQSQVQVGPAPASVPVQATASPTAANPPAEAPIMPSGDGAGI